MALANLSSFIHHHLLLWPTSIQSKPTSTTTLLAPVNSDFSHPSHSHLQTLNTPTPLTNSNHMEQYSKDLMTSSDGGPPRWFSPLDSRCSSRLPNSPLLLYLPGIGGTGFGLSLHHRRLGEMFDIWCLHIPATDRTPFSELVKLVESSVKSENCQLPERPIYLVGESFGACLALAVAARNPGIDILLVLANSATSYRSQLRPLIPLLEAMPKELGVGLHYMLNLMKDVAEVFTVETLVWKLRLLDSASSYTNSRLHAVKAQTLILSSGRDELLPSREEGERLHRLLPKSDIRTFDDSGHMLFMGQHIDLVTILKATSFYRRKMNLDYVLDYLPPSRYEFKNARESHRLDETRQDSIEQDMPNCMSDV